MVWSGGGGGGGGGGDGDGERGRAVDLDDFVDFGFVETGFDEVPVEAVVVVAGG